MNQHSRMSRGLLLASLPLLASLLGRAALAQGTLRFAPSESLEFESSGPNIASVTRSFVGVVYALDGTLAEGAIVVSSAGGKAATDAFGKFRLEVQVPRDAEHVSVTAIGRGSGTHVASQRVPLSLPIGPVSTVSLQLSQSSACIPSWLPTFGQQPGTRNAFPFEINALATFDDGTGLDLYAGGHFVDLGGVISMGLAKWDGSRWSMVGPSLTGGPVIVNSLQVFDDGNGPALYVGGEFTGVGGMNARHVAKWTGSSWAPISFLFDVVHALAVFDDGSGPALFAGGERGRLSKLTGAGWVVQGTVTMNSAFEATIFALTAFDDGGGEELYAGGEFEVAGGVSADGLAKWNGVMWLPVGAGLGAGGIVKAFCTFDDGNGEHLYIGGDFNRYVAKWGGTNLIPMMGLNGEVRSLAVFDDGSGAALHAGGRFTFAQGVATNQVAKLSGASWTPLGSGVSSSLTSNAVSALARFDDGSGEVLVVVGKFDHAGDLVANRVAQWDGSSWSALGAGLDSAVLALASFDDGSGPALYAGGDFETAGGIPASRIAKWDGSSWAELASGTDDIVRALTAFDDGSGAALYAGGQFSTVGGVSAPFVAKWNGSSWLPVGSGPNGRVYCMAVFDDGTGAALYAGGTLTAAGGQPANRIAKWDGVSWAPVGTGMDGPVYTLTVFDDGGGAELIAGGFFTSAGGAAARGVAKWNGTNWSRLGSGVAGTASALLAFDDGSGSALFVGGTFNLAGGAPANRIAKWDGSSWSTLGQGASGTVSALMSFDDGGGTALYVGGTFQLAGGLTAKSIAKWDGSSWSALGGGTGTGVSAFAVFDDGGGAALFAGGSFASTFDSGDSHLAKWGCPSVQFSDFCNGDGGDQGGCTDCPCMNNAVQGTVGGCLNSALTSARLHASGNPSVNLLPGDTSDLRFSVTNARPNTICLLTSGDSVAPTNSMHPCFGNNSGIQANSFDGLRCAAANTRRHGGRASDANGDVGITNAPWGGEAGPSAGIAVAGRGFSGGQTRFFQVIHRDDPLLQCMRGLNTSQSLRVVFTPVP